MTVLMIIGIIGCSLSSLGFLVVVFAIIAAKEFKTREKVSKIPKRCGIVGAILLVVGFCIAAPILASSPSNGKQSATCQICHTTYTYDNDSFGGYSYENVRSINRTNMCVRCYNNYKSAMDFKDKSQYID